MTEGPRDEVLGERDEWAARGGRQRQHGREVRVHGTEQGTVLHVPCKPRRIPVLAAHHSTAEQLDVVILAAEHELVERLLERPNGRRDRAADGPPQRAGAIDARAHPPQL
jgi:hypothetical protein